MEERLLKHLLGLLGVSLICATSACGGKTKSTEPSPGESKEAFTEAVTDEIEKFCTSALACQDYDDDDLEYEYYDDDYSYDSVEECTEYLSYGITTYFDLGRDKCREALFTLIECLADNYECGGYSYYACERPLSRVERLECFDYDYYGYDSGSPSVYYGYPLPIPYPIPNVPPPTTGSGIGGVGND